MFVEGWLVARVGSFDVLIEVDLGCEGILASLDRAEEWLLAGVCAHVRFQVPFLVKCLVAPLEGADEVAHAGMFFQVHLKSLVDREALATTVHGTLKLLD